MRKAYDRPAKTRLKARRLPIGKANLIVIIKGSSSATIVRSFKARRHGHKYRRFYKQYSRLLAILEWAYADKDDYMLHFTLYSNFDKHVVFPMGHVTDDVLAIRSGVWMALVRWCEDTYELRT